MDEYMNSLPSHTQILMHMIFINIYMSKFTPECFKVELSCT